MIKVLPCLLFLAAAPVLAEDPPARKAGPALLPPKWGKLIQNVPAPAGTPAISSSALSGKDLGFLATAIRTARRQTLLCGMAQEKAATPEVRALGGSLAELNASQLEYLLDLAGRKGVAVENTAPAAQKKLKDEMGRYSGLKFDKEVTEQILANEQQSVAAYEAAVGSEDVDVKTRAQELLPIAKANLQLAGRVSGHSQDTSATPTFRAAEPGAPPAAAGKGPAPTAPEPPAPRGGAGAVPAPMPPPIAAPPPIGEGPAPEKLELIENVQGTLGAPLAPAPAAPPPRPPGPKPAFLATPPARP